MKKAYLLLVIVLVLTGCSTRSIDTEIPDEKFDFETEIQPFDVQVYIDQINPVISSLDYIRLDSVFSDNDTQKRVVITNRVVENILQIFNTYSQTHDSYDLINFLDLHIKKIDPIDVDILVFKLISKVEKDYEKHKEIVEEEQFNYLIVDYISRITDTFIDSYDVNAEVLNDYPNMYRYLDRLSRIVNGGYQIRRYEDRYYLFPDYASFLLRYKEYYSEETMSAVEILVRESRNLVWIGDRIQVDNEAIAYKTNEIENFMKHYPNSVYYKMMRDYYVNYLETIVSNPSNIKEVASDTYHYTEETVEDFKIIIERYASSQMARLLETFVATVEEDEMVYDQEKIAELITEIRENY